MTVAVTDATAFTLFGSVVTGERVGVPGVDGAGACATAVPVPAGRRVGLPLV